MCKMAFASPALDWGMPDTDRNYLVLTFSVVANGSSLAYAKNAGASLSTLRLSQLCDLALYQRNAKTR